MFIRFLLRRALFKGQFKLFLLLRKHGLLKTIKKIDRPITGNFSIHLDTQNYIDACIYYTGDYEPYLKVHYKDMIKPGNTVLDIGANIGFHSLYFAELTGKTGKVICFEPIKINFNALEANVQLNDFPQIMINNIALGDKNEAIAIHIDPNDNNPGAFNLFESGEKNYSVKCERGDDFLNKKGIKKVDFIKIDVEGYEYEVMKGIKSTIQTSRPIINFEYDSNYQSKNAKERSTIFGFLSAMDYKFDKIDGYGNKSPFTFSDDIKGAEIIATPNHSDHLM